MADFNPTIKGITYSVGQSFKAAVDGTWYGGADGSNGHGNIPKGSTLTFYGDYTGTASWYVHPYLIDPNGLPNTSNREWTDSNVFPSAKYTVSFNANGGTNAPAAQEKEYGISLTITTSKPTRSGYSFLRWNTKADGTGTNYASGASYTANSNLALYAIWEASYVTTLTVNNSKLKVGDKLSVTWTPNLKTQKFRIQVYYNSGHSITYPSTSAYITPNTTSSYTYTAPSSIPTSWLDIITAASYPSIQVRIRTYDANGTEISPTSSPPYKSVNLYPDDWVNPGIVVYTEALGNENFQNLTYPIQKVSRLKVYINSLTLMDGANFNHADVTFCGTTQSYSTSITTGTIFPASAITSYGNSVPIKVVAYDSRGRTATSSTSVKVINYFNPILNSVTYDFNESSKKNEVYFSFTIASVSNTNIPECRIRRRPQGGSWTTIKAYSTFDIIDDGRGKYTDPSTAAETTSYEYEVVLRDSVPNTTEAKTVLTSVLAISFLRGGNGVSFFGEATQPGVDIKSGGLKVTSGGITVPATGITVTGGGVHSNAFYIGNNNLLTNILYPVGSVVVMSTNTSPASRLGGTWTLVDRGFEYLAGSWSTLSSDYFTANTTNVNSCSGLFVREGRTITIRMNVNMKVELTGTDVVIGTINYTNMGITITSSHVVWVSGFKESNGTSTDGGMAMVSIANSSSNPGRMLLYDIVPKSDNTSTTIPAGGADFRFFFTDVIPTSAMISSHVDKWYWKRTA